MNILRRSEPSWTPAELEELIAETSPDLLAYLVRRTVPSEDAADVLAESLVTVWRRRHDIPPSRDRARAWMFVVARNQLANHQRGHARRLALAERLRDQLAQDDDRGTESETTDRVTSALSYLPDADQELITLIIWDGLRVADAGMVLGMSASTARTRYSRAKARFARALAALECP